MRISLDSFLLAMETENLMILYEDNAVEVHYMDGSGLLLSPCGSEFSLEKAIPPSAHPVQLAERVRQRTQFALSLYRKQLLRALDFRNQYSDRPYLPSNLIPSERKNIIFTDVCEAKWPHPDAAGELICRHNGGVKVSSSDGHACLFLSELQQEFSVESLCRVSQKLSKQLPLLQSRCKKTTKDWCSRPNPHSVSRQLQPEEKAHECSWSAENHTQVNKSEKCSSPTHEKDEISGPFLHSSYEYCKVTQHLSVSSCPEEWKYPLSLAFMFYHTCASNTAASDERSRDHRVGGPEVSLECENSRTVTCLPLALPLSCEAPYFHSWNFCHLFPRQKEDIGPYSHSQPIKVVWSKGILYKFLLGFKSIEIYPGDGSVFKSEGSFWGKYFTRYFVQEGTKHREETMYSVSSLPPDMPGSPYSVCGIITQAIRILQHDLEALLSLTPSNSFCCWKVSSEADGREMLPVLLAGNVIPNVGRFLAYSDNKIHAAFYDGIVLSTVWDFSSHCGKSQGHQDPNLGWFKLISPDGTEQLLQMDYPGLYERHIRTVVEWCTSLNERRAVCTSTPQPLPEEHWSVAAELEKIKRFNFLVENSNIPSKVSTGKMNPSSSTNQNSPEEILLPEKINEKNVAETLEKTSKVINDIDCLLASSAKQSVVKHKSI